MALEPLNLSLARADAVQQVQNTFVAAERAGKAQAARETQEAGRAQPSTVQATDATEGNKVHDEDNGGALPYEGPPEKPREEPEKPAPATPADPEGKGRQLDITA